MPPLARFSWFQASSRPPRLRVSALTSVLCFFLTAPLHAATWQAEIKPGPKDNFTKAAFSLWLDESAPAPVAFLVIAPGWNGDGRNAINDRQWQTFAKANRLGLVGVCIQSNPDDQKPTYHEVKHGSGRAFLEGINRLATTAKQPSLSKTLPLLIWGHSAGGQFGYGMACFAPERVMAFAAIKGGYYLSKPTSRTMNVPGLFIIGERDEPFRAINITAAFEEGRAKGAPWCIAFESNSGHEVGRANDLIFPFFSGVLKLRTGSLLKPNQPVSTSTGWIGIRSSMEIGPLSMFRNTPLTRTVWLPDQAAAKAWKEF